MQYSGVDKQQQKSNKYTLFQIVRNTKKKSKIGKENMKCPGNCNFREGGKKRSTEKLIFA